MIEDHHKFNGAQLAKLFWEGIGTTSIAVKFVLSLVVMTIVCTLVWQETVAEWLYDCTDDNMLGFFRPGDWVHFYHGVVYVPKVVHDRSMSDPDVMKTGWSMTGLWCLWLMFVLASSVASVLLARMHWMPRRPGAMHES
jgi:hypothetical protein